MFSLIYIIFWFWSFREGLRQHSFGQSMSEIFFFIIILSHIGPFGINHYKLELRIHWFLVWEVPVTKCWFCFLFTKQKLNLKLKTNRQTDPRNNKQAKWSANWPKHRHYMICTCTICNYWVINHDKLWKHLKIFHQMFRWVSLDMWWLCVTFPCCDKIWHLWGDDILTLNTVIIWTDVQDSWLVVMCLCCRFLRLDKMCMVGCIVSVQTCQYHHRKV